MLQADDGFRCDVARFVERVIVGIHGDLDAASAPEFERAVDEMLAPPLRGIVLDLNYCPFVDSAGARALTRLRTRAHGLGIAFQITSVRKPVENVLRSFDLVRRRARAS